MRACYKWLRFRGRGWGGRREGLCVDHNACLFKLPTAPVLAVNLRDSAVCSRVQSSIHKHMICKACPARRYGHRSFSRSWEIPQPSCTRRAALSSWCQRRGSWLILRASMSPSETGSMKSRLMGGPTPHPSLPRIWSHTNAPPALWLTTKTMSCAITCNHAWRSGRWNTFSRAKDAAC